MTDIHLFRYVGHFSKQDVSRVSEYSIKQNRYKLTRLTESDLFRDNIFEIAAKRYYKNDGWRYPKGKRFLYSDCTVCSFYDEDLYMAFRMTVPELDGTKWLRKWRNWQKHDLIQIVTVDEGVLMDMNVAIGERMFMRSMRFGTNMKPHIPALCDKITKVKIQSFHTNFQTDCENRIAEIDDDMTFLRTKMKTQTLLWR